MVREFLTRVNQVNADPYYLYRIRKVLVFGSYLSKAEKLGDIDLAITLEPKEPDGERLRTLEDKRIQKASNAGKYFSNIVDQLFWPRREVEQFLRKRSRYLNFHPTEDGVLKMTKTRTLFKLAK